MSAAAQRAKTIFLKALEILSTSERRAYLDAECGGDAALQGEIEALLGHYGQLGSFLESPAMEAGAGRHFLPAESLAATADDPIRERPGTVIGRYKLLEQIGEGGMGLVFAAEQQEPVKRRVALKIIKPGMDSRQVIARFEAERQALAMMDHPHIAQVHDGGATPEGRPYFVMELVKGTPITDYCDQHRLSTRQRLELFRDVCRAVQHAHQKGIIHRDLKPSNVLVSLHDVTPVTKVIDFGVAKALGQELTGRTLLTGIAQMIGTPLYMSPEQAGMGDLDVDTRSDIYSLGVLLYELLTGTTPFAKERFKKAAYDEIRRIIREEEPPKPSTRLSESKDTLRSVSALRQTEPAKLIKLVRGELDWIVMKALEKDRNRRYETANGFTQDIQRYLADEPVQAGPPSARYRFRKFARRNRRALATAALLAVALIVTFGAVAGSVGWAMSDRAAQRARTAGEVDQYLRRAESLYAENKLPEAAAEVQKAASVLEAGGGDDDLRERVQGWAADLAMAAQLEELLLLEEYHGREPNPADYVRVFREYGLDVEAMPIEEAAARVAASRIKPDLMISFVEWADPIRGTSASERRRLLAIVRAADPDSPILRIADAEGDARTLRELANVTDPKHLGRRGLAYLAYSLCRAGAPDAAVKLRREVRRRHPDDFLITETMSVALYAHSLATSGDRFPGLNEIIALRLAAVALRPDSALAHSVYGDALRLGGHTEAAVAACREAVRLLPNSIKTRGNLALALSAAGKHPEAIAEARAAVALAREDGQGHLTLAQILFNGGAVDEAITEYREAVRLLPDRDVDKSSAYLNVSAALFTKGSLAEAERAAREATRLSPTWAKPWAALGDALGQQGQWDEAIASYREAIRLHPGYAEAHVSLGSALGKKKGDWEGAVDACHAALRAKPDYALAHFYLGNALFTLGSKGEGVAAFRAAIRHKPDYWQAHDNLGWTLAGMDRLDEALTVYEKAINHMPDNLKLRLHLVELLVAGPDPKKWDGKRAVELLAQVGELGPKDATYWWLLAVSRYRAGDWKESIATFQKSWEFRNGRQSKDGFVLAMAYWRLGDRDEARKWYDEAARWLERAPATPVNELFRRFREEAAALLGEPVRREAAPPPRIKP